MKRLLVVLFITVSLLLTGCSSTKLKPATSGDIINYQSSAVFGSIDETSVYYYITVSADKTVIWGNSNEDGFGSKKLSDDEFQELIDLVYTSKFKNMGSDISDNSIMDGSSKYITVRYADGSVFKTGGLNPTKKTFTKVEEKLRSYTK